MQQLTHDLLDKMERENNQRKLEASNQRQEYLLQQQLSEQRYANERIERKLNQVNTPIKKENPTQLYYRPTYEDYGTENHIEGFLVTVGIITAIVLFIFFVSNRKQR